jgi:hypothetical protein
MSSIKLYYYVDNLIHGIYAFQKLQLTKMETEMKKGDEPAFPCIMEAKEVQ